MDFEIILQECSLGDSLPKLPKWFCTAEQNGHRSARMNKMAARAKNRKTFKSLLLLNQWMDFEIISHERSLGDPLPKLLKPFCSDEQDGFQS